MGIHLIQKISEIPEIAMKDEFVIQEYLDKPMLIENKKFDLRMYLVCFGLEPM